MVKFYDVPAVMQVIGGVYLNPTLLSYSDKYYFNENDFAGEEFHKILFGTIYNLFNLGVEKIKISTIENFLEQRPKAYAVYKLNRGAEYLKKLEENTQLEAFDYYYNRIKKMTLLRGYSSLGLDLTWLYDEDNIFDPKKKQTQEDFLDNSTLEEISNLINDKIDRIKVSCIKDVSNDMNAAGDGVLELIQKYEQTPDVGYPLFGHYVNAIHRGARLKKFYLRSAATGVGKTRAMIADACYVGSDKFYDLEKEQWISIGTKEPVLFIATEQETSEIQTMMLAFLSGVDEEHILINSYLEGEKERTIQAANLLEDSNIYIKELPDFSLQDIEETIKHAIRVKKVKYVFFDYLHTSVKILSEIGVKSGVKNLREDNILFLISVKLKDLCNKYGVFILTSTQLNSDYQVSDHPDQNLLRGAKAIADKIDFGSIMLQVTKEDEEKIKPIVDQLGFQMPSIKISIYKNRGNKYRGIYLWCNADKSICRIDPIFVTDWNMSLIEIEDLDIQVK